MPSSTPLAEPRRAAKIGKSSLSLKLLRNCADKQLGMQWFTRPHSNSKDPLERVAALSQLLDNPDRQSRNRAISALSDPAAEVRLHALRVVVHWNDDTTMKAVVKLVNDPEPPVRAQAIAELRTIRRRETIPAIVPALKDPVGAVRSQAVAALETLGWSPQNSAEQVLDLIARGQFGKAAALGGNAFDLLLAFIDQASSSTRREAAEAFGNLRGPHVISTLEKLLKDADPTVRIAAINSLAEQQTSIASICRMTSDTDKNVRIAAVEALGDIKETEAVPLLCDLMRDSDWEVRCAVAKAMGFLRERTTVPILVRGLSDPDADVRSSCADALGMISDVEAIEPLIGAQLDTETKVRHAALQAVLKVDYRWHCNPRAYRTLPVIRRALRSNDFSIRNAAADLMERVFGVRKRSIGAHTGDPETDRKTLAANLFTASLWDDDPLLRGAAAETLGHMRNKRAVDVLKVRTQDSDPWVARQAEAALAQIEGVARLDAGWRPKDALQQQRPTTKSKGSLS